jgi:hypothetical protein
MTFKKGDRVMPVNGIIDGASIEGMGTVVGRGGGHTIVVNWDNPKEFMWEYRGYEDCWSAHKDEIVLAIIENE